MFTGGSLFFTISVVAKEKKKKGVTVLVIALEQEVEFKLLLFR